MRFSTVISGLAVATTVLAAPMDVWSPPILVPNATTVWTVGQVATVTWDASNPPSQISNRGSIHLQGGDIVMPYVFDDGLDLKSGSASFTVPEVMTADNYTITLFGDSGNISPAFQIINPNSASYSI